MLRSLGLLGGCLVASITCASQPFTVVVGGEGLDRGVGILALTSGGYAVTGITSSLGAGGEDGMVARFDENGSLVWQTTVGGEGNDASWQVEETAAGLAEVGFGVRPGTGLDCRLSRLSPQGDLQWSRHYGGAGDERCWDLVAVGNDGYALVGEVVIEDETVHDCLLIRTDAGGKERWKKTYDKGLQERCFAVAGREDGGFLLVGQTTEDGGDERDVYLVGTDSDGGVAFEHVLGAEGIDLGHGVVSIPRGEMVIGYTAGFESEDEDPLLVKVTPEGEVAWTRRVPLPGPSRSLSGAITSDGALCLGGYRRIEGEMVAFVAKTDLDARLAWSVDLEPFLLGYTVASAGDGGCVLTGHTEGDEGDLDFFLARVASDGSRASGADRYELSSGTVERSAGVLEEALDSIVAAEAMGRGVPGLAVVVVADGEVAFQRAYGYADLSTGRVATAATPFNIASVTKPFTSAVVMQLVEEGKLSLEDRVKTHLAWLPVRYEALTVYQLLTHTSGIARDLRLDNFDDPDESTYRARLDTASASASAGERFEYSNTGYTVLGWLVEAVEGAPLERVLERRIFEPLGMRQARYRAPLAADPLRARPHAMTDEGPVAAEYITGGFASGGMSMSTADAAAFGLALQEGSFLSPSSAESVWRPARLGDGRQVEQTMFGEPASYGFGWFLTDYNGHIMYTHGGGIEGYSANLYHFPEGRLTIVVLANIKSRDDGVAPVDPLARRIADWCLEHDLCRLAPLDNHRASAVFEERR